MVAQGLYHLREFHCQKEIAIERRLWFPQRAFAQGARIEKAWREEVTRMALAYDGIETCFISVTNRDDECYL
jgi:hypothetical protein